MEFDALVHAVATTVGTFRRRKKDTMLHATILSDLVAHVSIPADGTLSRTIFQDDQVKAILFGFAAGQELSEHTAATAAILHVVQGEAQLTLGTEVIEARANTWIHMPPQLPHRIVATTPVVLLLLLFKPTALQP
ncbi:MAG: cupin domain-containing protein [Chloroflexales bacterium]